MKSEPPLKSQTKNLMIERSVFSLVLFYMPESNFIHIITYII